LRAVRDTTGAVTNGPATQALDIYEVQDVEGGIRIKMPEAQL